MGRRETWNSDPFVLQFAITKGYTNLTKNLRKKFSSLTILSLYIVRYFIHTTDSIQT